MFKPQSHHWRLKNKGCENMSKEDKIKKILEIFDKYAEKWKNKPT
jgi:hypothetical protein